MRRTTLACGALVAIAAIASCGHSGGGGGSGLPSSGLGGVVFGYSDAPVPGVLVKWQDATGGGSAFTGPDGRFFLTPFPTGPHVLQVGDGNVTPSLFVAVIGSSSPTFLDRPVLMPSFDSATRASVPSGGVSVAAVISSDAVGGVELDLAAGASVAYPVGVTATTVSLVGVAPSRLPVAMPGGLVPRAAYLVEPALATFGGARLIVPRLHATGAGPFDLWTIDATTGQWKLAAPLATFNASSLSASISQGGLYAAVSRQAEFTTTVTGRIVANAVPVAGYRATCWNQVSSPTQSDGLFTIPAVPTSFGGFIVHVAPDRPGVDYAPELVSAFAPGPVTGDVQVVAAAADVVRPRVVTTSPSDNQGGVDIRSQIVVKFSKPIDPKSLGISVRGTNGPQAGSTIFDAPFQVRFVPATPLAPADGFTIVLDDTITDLAGNPITGNTVFHFTTQTTAPAPPPNDTLAFGLSPLVGSADDLLTISGRNFTGGSVVKVGASVATAVQESPTTIQVRAPEFEPAADAPITITEGTAAVALAGPFVLDLRASVAQVSSAIVERDVPPVQLVATGKNLSTTTLFLDGVSIATVETSTTIGTLTVINGKIVTLATPLQASVVSGPVSARGANGKPGPVYRFVQVRDGP